MGFLIELKNFVINDCLLVPTFAWFVAQLLKVLINGVVNKSFSAERLWGDGGMPSGHSATVTSLALMCGVKEGFGSTFFAIAAILAIIVMHDALGVRRETGKQAVSFQVLCLSGRIFAGFLAEMGGECEKTGDLIEFHFLSEYRLHLSYNVI